jgi:hypothetical protein
MVMAAASDLLFGADWKKKDNGISTNAVKIRNKRVKTIS